MKTLLDLNIENGKDEYGSFRDCFDLKTVTANPIINFLFINVEETKKLKSEKSIVLNNIKLHGSTDLATNFEVYNINPPKGKINFWIANSKFKYDKESQILTIPIWLFNRLETQSKRENIIAPNMAWDQLQNEIAMRGGYENQGFAGLDGEEASDAYWNCN